ncbi:grasp-with-spasm system SPASM domain peptide maturase [Flavobacterium sp. LS1R49]|uniref:Grasp-with-spasm system SPASM domain peptide maturase n=1 Tax=Flavobacterium shii TaxID=2987687 RepID=A0A9X2YWX1_9FLAO|nr:grasp-with-spasm system SPASM domain peptide maturase [Flavobacterium shii]MCV9930048.1 grasp-with-spasm system SPASM domain peptide maturase [Flavobacterium shii]
MINKEFKLFSNCLTVKGLNRGVIIDVQRKTYHVFSNQIIDFVNEYSGEKIYNLFNDFKEYKVILKKYMQYFLDNELAIITNDSSQFPAISHSFDRPYSIDTIILDMNLSKESISDLLKLKVDDLGISCLKLVAEVFDEKKTIEILRLLETTKIKTIVIFIKYTKGIENKVLRFDSKFSRLVEIVFYNVDGLDLLKGWAGKKFVYEKKSLNEILTMKVQNQDDFVLNLEAFNESLIYNSAYNRTIYIDENGNVKRYLGDKLSFGHIDYVDLNNVVENEGFSEFWKITKDKITICRDCEFRYICPDGSIPFKQKDTDLFFSTNLKCNYDPYKNEWLNLNNN